MNPTGANEREAGADSHVGVLLVNLGTPDEPTPAALRRYLAEFLWDPRVVDVPRPLWWLILNGIILNTRPKRSAALYQKIWTDDGSPLLVIGRHQVDGIKRLLRERLDDPPQVMLGMRYGQPSIAQGLAELHARGCRRLLILPLYPQYCGATTLSTFDAVEKALIRWDPEPHIHMIPYYHDNPAYIGALVASITQAWAGRERPDRLLFSFHGMPVRNATAEEPYARQCRETAQAAADSLGLAEDEWIVAFQSRFGPGKWLEPATDETLRRLGAEGVGRVDVVCPGFAADCLETLEEIAHTNREFFLEAGGREFHYIPALNDRPEHLAALTALILDHLPELDMT